MITMISCTDQCERLIYDLQFYITRDFSLRWRDHPKNDYQKTIVFMLLLIEALP